MAKILITGHKGFIGSHLYKHAKKIPDALVAAFDAEYFDEPNWIDTLKQYLSRTQPDVIFHVGACSDTLNENVNYMMQRNFESTKIISDYCTYMKIPLIYSSSASAYGTNNLYPSNLYGWSKYMGEQYVIKNGGIALRYFNVYGPGEEHKGKMASVAYQMFTKAYHGEEVVLYPKNPRRDFIYVDDVINANIYAYENFNNITKGYYDVGVGEARSFEDVMNYMEITFRYCNEVFIPNGYQFYTCSDKNKWLPYWTPTYTLEYGIIKYKSYLDENTRNR